MTNEINVYKELTAIETFDWIEYTTASLSELNTMFEWKKFIQIWEKLIAIHQIKSCYRSKISWVEWFILSLDKDIQRKVRQRDEEKKSRVGKWFDSIDQINKWLQDEWLI